MPLLHTYRSAERISPEHFSMLEPLLPGQMDLALFLENCSHPDKRIVDCFAHGRFCTEDPDTQIIFGSWLSRHEEAWLNEFDHGRKIDVTCFGLDVARSFEGHGDASVLACGGQSGLRCFSEWHVKNTIELADSVIAFAATLGVNLKAGRNPIAIDMGGGYGGGVLDQLRRLGVWCIEFQPNGTATINPRLWANLRTQSYATLAGRFDPTGPFHNKPWGIPTDERLRRELVAPERKKSKDLIRFGIEPKEQIKKEKLNGQSPDYADAATMLWHAVVEYANLQAYFAQYTGPLLISPTPDEHDKKWLSWEHDRRAAIFDSSPEAESIYANLKLDLTTAAGDNGKRNGNGSGGHGGQDRNRSGADGNGTESERTERTGQGEGGTGGTGGHGNGSGSHQSNEPTVAATLDWLRRRYGTSQSASSRYARLFGDGDADDADAEPR